MGIISKDTIETYILPHLTIGQRGFETTVPLTEIVEAILHRLKTGCQWRELPVKQFFKTTILSWNTVFYYFNKWSKQGCWRKIWIAILSSNLKYLDLSSVQFDGSHTPSKNGGDAVGYQGRKACNTTNSLFMADNQGDRRTGLCSRCPHRKRDNIMIYFKYSNSLMKSVTFSKKLELT